jgi:UDP-2,3-diacylglucosamine pyrophosphatase LpxH
MKKIFISDIHMNDARSMEGKRPYGWFRKNIKNLEKFLNELLVSSEVEEVVILGDLFDRWVIPAALEPIISFQEICNTSENKKIIEALQKLAEKQLLTYLPGNHDMSFSPADQVTTKEFMETCFQNIRYLVDPALPHGVYDSGTLAGEHGNLYGLFNSPDTWYDLDSFLPMGYFMSRLMATKASRTAVRKDYQDILKGYVNKWIYRPNFIKELFIDLARYAGLKKTDRINVNGIYWSANNTIDAIGSYYEDLLQKWPPAERGQMNWEKAIFGDIGFLDLALYNVYFLRPEAGKNMVIFGHTHMDNLYMTIRLKELPLAEEIRRGLPEWAIYANCGTWIDSGRYCSYVETEADAGANRLYVRLWEYYPKKKLRQEGFVKI